MAPKKKPQTEAKAKGLIGWKDGKRDKSAPNSVGDYKGKTLNLTKKQVAKAGGAAATKASRNTVSISDTKFEKGKGVLGKDGKALNGRVDMGGGNFAVYVNGKRVGAKAAGPASSGSGSAVRSGSGSGSAATPRKVSAVEKAAGYKGKGRSAMEQARAAQAKKTTEAARKRRMQTQAQRLTAEAAAYKKGTKKTPPTKSMKAPINWRRTTSW